MSCSEWWGMKSYSWSAAEVPSHCLWDVRTCKWVRVRLHPLASHRTPCSHNEILLQISPLSQEKLAVIPRKLNLHLVLWGKISFMCEGMGQNPQPKHRECFWVEEKAVHPGMQHVARGSRSNKKGENKGQTPISIPRKCYLAGTHTCHSLTKC